MNAIMHLEKFLAGVMTSKIESFRAQQDAVGSTPRIAMPQIKRFQQSKFLDKVAQSMRIFSIMNHLCLCHWLQDELWDNNKLWGWMEEEDDGFQRIAWPETIPDSRVSAKLIEVVVEASWLDPRLEGPRKHSFSQDDYGQFTTLQKAKDFMDQSAYQFSHVQVNTALREIFSLGSDMEKTQSITSETPTRWIPAVISGAAIPGVTVTTDTVSKDITDLLEKMKTENKELQPKLERNARIMERQSEIRTEAQKIISGPILAKTK